MQRRGMQALRAVAPFDLVREVDVCRLALAVRSPWIVGFLFEIVVVKPYGATAVADGANGHYAGWEFGC